MLMAHARATDRGFAIAAAAAPWTDFGFCVAMLLLMALLASRSVWHYSLLAETEKLV
jgi:hypothetical protein